MNVDLTRKVTVITGAGRGIGEVLAHRFAAESRRVALIDLNGELLERVARDVRTSGADVLPVVCNVSDSQQVSAAVAEVVKHFGSLDVLVNNAGIAPDRSIETMSASEWDETFAVNTRGVFLMSQAAIPHMKAARSGRILSASSFAAVIPSLGFAAYAASKAAVEAFTRVLAAEVGPWNITANAYLPGMVPTPLNQFLEAPPAKQERLLNTLAVRRWETGDDVASLLIFLASDLASYITGASIEVTGGKFAVQFPHLAYENIQ